MELSSLIMLKTIGFALCPIRCAKNKNDTIDKKKVEPNGLV